MSLWSIGSHQMPSAVGTTFVPFTRMTASGSSEPFAAAYSTTQSTLSSFDIEKGEDLQSLAFDALADAKRLFSLFSMHFDDGTRKRLFLDLDRLHDIDEWEEGDSPLQISSFRTFLRSLLIIKPKKWPSLGLSYDGVLFGIWGTAKDRVTLEFHGDDEIRFILSHVDDRDIVSRSAGVTELRKILDLLSPFSPRHWFDGLRKDT